ncbi:unnamed protein product [Ambrosiozyma monospora]|uniref:Unnamed protein product n=1 Tax=Ambrosiozyma monospora TaxID=43982 RepID=A0ACB5TWW3_AMBMO|nr:unnamed protein product [Ambrosiozyma monospora]
MSLLVDMVNLNEHSFDEFYDIWNQQEGKESIRPSNLAGTKQESDLRDQGSVKRHAHKMTDSTTASFDINESETFNYINGKGDMIADDLDYIKQAALNIDSYTKMLWDQL